jgi:hypothetical protein
MERQGPPPNTFSRSLLIDAHHKTLIRSVCKRCGTIILGSVVNGLPRQEKEHVERCNRMDGQFTERSPEAHAVRSRIKAQRRRSAAST